MQYEVGKAPKRNTGFWTQAAGYLWWHKTEEAAQNHAARIQWTDASVWSCRTGEVL